MSNPAARPRHLPPRARTSAPLPSPAPQGPAHDPHRGKHSIPQELNELFAAANNGRQPPLSLHAQMVCAPAVLAAYVGIRRALEEHGTLDRRTRLALMLAVSSIDRCEYTQAVHTMLATRAGFEE